MIEIKDLSNLIDSQIGIVALNDLRHSGAGTGARRIHRMQGFNVLMAVSASARVS